MLEMKKLLLLLLLPLISTQGLTEDNKVYFCNETKNIFIYAEDGKVESYKLDSFSFKNNEDSIIKMIGPSFGGKDHVIGPYTALDVRANDNIELVAYTNGIDKRLMSYSKDDGAFQYTNHRWNGIRVVTASCSVFDD
jgi:hypothetical protein